MMERLEARGAEIAAAAEARAIARVAERAREAMPGIAVTPSPAGVTLAGRGLGRRMLADAALRWIGSLVR
ncbi:MAG TPA: hypothetical protein VFT56_05720 [Sphingomonas sp.]|nr:hypothetical protein [Sphingomonas sp.]